MTGLNPAFRDDVMAKRAGLAPPLVPDLSDMKRRPAPRDESPAQILRAARELFALATRERAEAAQVLADARVEAEMIRSLAREEAALPPLRDVRAIIAEVSGRHGVSIAQIRGVSRHREIMAARREAITLAHAARPDLTLAALGRLFCRDHTAIFYALRKAGRGG